MRWRWTLDPGSGTRADVVVDAAPDATLGAIGRALGWPADALAAAPPDTASDDLGAGASAVHGGGLVPARTPLPDPDGVVLSVRSGPLAGHVVSVTAARATVGRSRGCEVTLADPAVSKTHLIVELGAGGSVRIAPAEGAGRVVVDGRELAADGATVGPDDLIELGSSVCTIGPVPHEPAHTRRDASGRVAFNRPSRIRARRVETRIAFPGPRPEAGLSMPLPWAMAGAPVVLGVVMAVVLRTPTMLMMSVMSPVMVIASYRSQKSMTAKRGTAALRTWRAAHAQALDRLSAAAATERSEAWRRLPDPASIRTWCVRRSARLWERRADDDDALRVRVGVAEGPLPVQVSGNPDGSQDPFTPMTSPVPVSVDLREAGVLGIAGADTAVAATTRWIALQLAALRSPRDLQLVLLTADHTPARRWAWFWWLPHAHDDRPGAPAARIGNDPASRAARLAELDAEISARQQSRLDARSSDRAALMLPEIVVIADGVRGFRDETGVSRVLRDGPSVGIHLVCGEADRTRLPEQVRAEVVVDTADPTLAFLASAGDDAATRVLLDGISSAVADEAARGLTPLLHVGGDGDRDELPTTARLTELLELGQPGGDRGGDPADGLARAWAGGARSTSAVVGVDADGPFSLDLRVDGPHALVAGTTGSGKSEFLQTWVCSLATVNRPDALTFVLVDYKGGSAFAGCEQLPHVVGMVTNLDARQTERALASLDAELVRRERELAALGMRDLDALWDTAPDRARERQLPRLAIVIDEFAELNAEHPGFIAGLVRIARVGRSLGIHLILATQRPSGVVSGEMQANVSLRVALRVADRDNSLEILGAPDAAMIPSSQPGRAFVRNATGRAPAEFQTARVALPRAGARVGLPVAVHRVDWDTVGHPVPTPPAPSAVACSPVDTDVTLVAAAARAAARALAIAPQPTPWLPPLPNVVTVADLAHRPGVTPSGRGDDGALWGLLDLPEQQRQTLLRYRPGDGHVLVGGSSRSGRSTVLRTLAAGLATGTGPGDVHLYALDLGGNALGPLRDLPHCGAVITGFETDRITRFLHRLDDEVSARQRLLAAGGFGDITEQRAAAPPATRLPHVVVLLDRWEALVTAYPLEELQEHRDLIAKLLRAGPAVGLAIVATGDRALLSDRIAAFFETRYTLRLSDHDDYRLAGIRPSDVPEDIPAGRGYVADSLTEIQFAVLADDTTGRAQTAALAEVVKTVADRAGGRAVAQRPFRLDVLPDHIELSAALDLPVAGGASGFTVGVGGDDLSQYRANPDQGPGFLVVGPPRTGRSIALASIVHQSVATGVPAAVVVPRPSPLAIAAADLDQLVLTDLGAGGADRLARWLAEHPRCLVAVDDADLVHGTPVDDLLVHTARARERSSWTLAVAAPLDDLASTLRGVAVEAKRHGRGVLLSPSSTLDGALFGPGLPRPLLGRAGPGRALLCVEGTWTAVQIPSVEIAG